MGRRKLSNRDEVISLLLLCGFFALVVARLANRSCVTTATSRDITTSTTTRKGYDMMIIISAAAADSWHKLKAF
jgi:hypothetical protein